MKEIHLDVKEVLYPITCNIQQSLPTINLVTDTLKKSANNKGRMVLCCMGSSGAIMAGIAASKISNVVILHVKKEGEHAHNTHKSFAFVSDDYIVIIDDFMSTGTTVRRIYSFLEEEEIKVNCIALAGAQSCTSLIKEINPELFIYTNTL